MGMSEAKTTGRGRIDGGRWLTGAVAGAAGAAVAAIILIGVGPVDPVDLGGEAMGVLLMPGAVFGLAYAGLATVPQVADVATDPATGLVLGLGFGVLFWLSTLLTGPVTTSGLLASLAFGAVLGLLYGASPYTGRDRSRRAA